MGFKAKTYRIKFADGEYQGLEVVLRGMSVDNLTEVAGMSGIDIKNVTPADLQKVKVVFEIFAERLVEWNLEDENDQPIATDRETVFKQDQAMILAVFGEWSTHAAGVMPPLHGASRPTGFDEQSIPQLPHQ